MPDNMRTSGEDAFGVMFGVTIPLWGGKNRARIADAESEVDAAKANLENMTNASNAAADKIYWQLRNAGRLVELYRNTLLPEAQKAAALAQTWYEAGQAPFSQMIESRLVVSNFELATARAEADYFKTLAELQRLAGVPVTEIASADEATVDNGAEEAGE
jgi:cobalt-zinc-cadmium efflux system outer membrane protein